MKLLTSISAALTALGLLNSYATASPLQKGFEPTVYGAPQTTIVGERVEKLYRHPECLGWEVEEIEDGIFSPKCEEWKFHKGGDYSYRHHIVYEEVELYGQECTDWRVDVYTRRVGKHHDRTIALPFCNDPGSVNGEIDMAFLAVSEDVGLDDKPM